MKKYLQMNHRPISIKRISCTHKSIFKMPKNTILVDSNMTDTNTNFRYWTEYRLRNIGEHDYSRRIYPLFIYRIMNRTKHLRCKGNINIKKLRRVKSI